MGNTWDGQESSGGNFSSNPSLFSVELVRKRAGGEVKAQGGLRQNIISVMRGKESSNKK